jgi:hypothetical protein
LLDLTRLLQATTQSPDCAIVYPVHRDGVVPQRLVISTSAASAGGSQKVISMAR